MSNRGRAAARTLSEAVVSDAGLVASAASPERQVIAAGSWDVRPALWDQGTPAAVQRGEFDDRLEELHRYAESHDANGPISRACVARLAEMGLDAPGSPAVPARHPDPQPMKASALRGR